MKMTIMRRIKFCAGHRLHQHGGKCEFFHGHNYIADFYVSAENVDEVGRVIDFSDLKRVFKGWIDENWDHSFLVSAEDSNGQNALKQIVPCRYFVLPYNPTAENMARYLLTVVAPQLQQQFPDYDVQITKVVVWETEDAFAEVSLDSSSDGLSQSPAFSNESLA
jgi:6-pyruvoyltetrahydropterin/6-carboxytetrahydropterin synthase